MSATTEKLITLLRERAEKGLAKYGQTLDRTDLTLEQWLQHQVEELLDGAGYALRALEEVRSLRDLLAQALSDLSSDGREINRLRDLLAQANDERRELLHQLACARGLNSALGEG